MLEYVHKIILKTEKYITKHINKYEFPFSNINKDAKKNDY